MAAVLCILAPKAGSGSALSWLKLEVEKWIVGLRAHCNDRPGEHGQGQGGPERCDVPGKVPGLHAEEGDACRNDHDHDMAGFVKNGAEQERARTRAAEIEERREVAVRRGEVVRPEED